MNKTTETFRCPKPKCGKEFNSMQALRMHRIRVHTRAGRLGARKGAQAASAQRGGAPKWTNVDKDIEHALFLSKKRKYNAMVRAQNVAQGLTTTGKQRKRIKVHVIEGARVPITKLATQCPVCSKPFKTRSILGAHVRNMHQMSLYDLPPYKADAQKTEEKEPIGTTVTIADDRTTVLIKTRFGLKELVNYILET